MLLFWARTRHITHTHQEPENLPRLRQGKGCRALVGTERGTTGELPVSPLKVPSGSLMGPLKLPCREPTRDPAETTTCGSPGRGDRWGTERACMRDPTETLPALTALPYSSHITPYQHARERRISISSEPSLRQEAQRMARSRKKPGKTSSGRLVNVRTSVVSWTTEYL